MSDNYINRPEKKSDQAGPNPLDAIQIRLSNSELTAIVSPEDYEMLSLYRWRWEHGYARTGNTREGLYSKMEYLIIGKPIRGLVVDHINRNKLDNRRANLRIVTRAQNSMNRGGNTINTSGYKGVSWSNTYWKWRVQIKLNRKGRSLGTFADLIDAVTVYNEAALRLHGQYAFQNRIPIEAYE